MKKNKKWFTIAVLVSFLFAGLAIPAMAAEVSITGHINDNMQLVGEDEQIYEIGENEQGDALVSNVDKKVKVNGTLEESEGTRVIMVTSFELLEE
jgi:hypothetical protein